MKTQFAVSLSFMILAGVSIALVVAWSLYQLSKGRDMSLKSRALTLCVLSVGLVFSGLKFAQASFVLAKTGAGKVTGVGRELISTSVEVGSVGVLEGVGRAMEFYEEKWGAKEREALSGLEIAVESVGIKEEAGGQNLVAMLRIQNNGKEAVNLNKLLRKQQVLVKSTSGLCFPIAELQYQEGQLPAGVASGRELKVKVPEGVELVAIVTPFQEVPLGLGE